MTEPFLHPFNDLVSNMPSVKTQTQFGNENSLRVIFPFKQGGIWMFDDEATSLVHEPFVGNVNRFIDWLTREIADAEAGFCLIFSVKPFPGYGMMLKHVKEEYEGNWYACNELEDETGWLCPALYKYFPTAPATLFLKAETRS